MKNIIFIVNPNAGGNKNNIWEEIQDLLKKKGVNYEYYTTKARNDALENVQSFIKKGYRDFVVVGGDGTTNEVLNGIFSQTEVPYSEISMGSISLGTGNDWNRYYGWPANIEDSIERILNKNITKQDVGVIKFYENGKQIVKYFANVAGFGFDANIVKMTNSMTHQQRGKELIYLLSLLKCLIKCKKIKLRIQADNYTIVDNILSISIGNGKYSGGGMRQTPDAIINDGLLDVGIFGNLSKFFVIKNVGKLYNGTINQITDNDVSLFKAQNIKIECNHPTIAEIDGEIIGTGPYEISIIKQGLNVID